MEDDMRAYFIATNVWLFLALAAFLGKSYERSQPTMYSFFGVGQWFYPDTYAYLIRVPLLLGTACFVMFLASYFKRVSRKAPVAG
jgi:hypothetical protein